jgi:hypothetical protein
MFIVTQFMLNEQQDGHKTDNPDGQAQDVQKRKGTIPDNVPEGNTEIAFNHGQYR